MRATRAYHMREIALRCTPIIAGAMLFFLLIISGGEQAFCQDHLRELDSVRDALGDFGKKMPDMIRNAQDKDMRTLERLFEINTYALTTIEAYLKMLRIAIAAEGAITKEITEIFNEWLQFITKYCKADMKYFDEALSGTNDQAIVMIIKEEKSNIENLFEVTSKGIEENKNMVK